MYYGMAALFRLDAPFEGSDHVVVNIMVGAACEDCVNTCEVFSTDATGTVVGDSMAAAWISTDPLASYETALSAIGFTLES